MSISRDHGTGVPSRSGSLSWADDATVTRTHGTTAARQRFGTATVSGTGTFAVTAGGQSPSDDVNGRSPA